MVKLLVCDVDGTLLPKGQTQLSNEVKNCFYNALSKGIKIAIASGRSQDDLKSLFCDFTEDMYFIAHDGALTLKNDLILHHNPIQSEPLQRIFNIYRDRACIAFYSASKCYIIGKNDPCVKSNVITNIKNIFEIKEQIFKIGIYGSNVKKATQADFVNGVRLCSLSENCIEYVSVIAEKGSALSDLQMRLFLTKFDTAAIGNYFNDIKMLKNAKYSAAMTASPAEVQNVAACVTDNAANYINEILKY